MGSVYTWVYTFFVKEEKRDGFEDIFQKLKTLKQGPKNLSKLFNSS